MNPHLGTAQIERHQNRPGMDQTGIILFVHIGDTVIVITGADDGNALARDDGHQRNGRSVFGRDGQNFDEIVGTVERLSLDDALALVQRIPFQEHLKFKGNQSIHLPIQSRLIHWEIPW